MVEVEATFEYIAEQPDELTIKVGDIIKNVIQSEGGWWEGELKGKKGMFPDNFVKIIEKDKKEEVKHREPRKDVQASKRQSVRDLANKIKDKVHDGPVPVRKKVKKRAKVVYAYEPENEDELRLSVGDMVDILKQDEEGWWEGIVNGKQGMMPSNFVEIVDESEPPAPEAAEKSESTEAEGNMIKGKKIHGIGLGNIFGDGPIKLRSTAGKKPTEPPKVEKPPQEPFERRPKELSKPVERAMVRYSYKAENEDELTLNEGEVITVLDKELEDGGWWRGEINGRTGVFPDNFVELLEEEVKPQVPTHPEKAPRPVVTPAVTPAAQPKPKRPQQPPVQVPALKPAPKIPEKAPVVDHPKPDPVKEEKPVVIPAKKPPPLTKKPTKPADVHEDKAKTETTNATGTFEAVEPTTDKLTHLTASRARGPTKRPPSQPKTNMTVVKEDERNGDVKDSHWLKEDKTAHIHPTLPERREEKPPHSIPVRPSEPPTVSPGMQLAIEELKREIGDLKTNTVTKSAFNELKADNEKLRQELESVKANYSRRLKDIMAEVDDEKKIRLSTQVEIERIRKLVAESHV